MIVCPASTFSWEKAHIPSLEHLISSQRVLAIGEGSRIFAAGPEMASERRLVEVEERVQDQKKGQEDEFDACLQSVTCQCPASNHLRAENKQL